MSYKPQTKKDTEKTERATRARKAVAAGFASKKAARKKPSRLVY